MAAFRKTFLCKLLIKNIIKRNYALPSFRNNHSCSSNGSINTDQMLKGWVTKIRKMKEVVFADISDGSDCCHTQVVIPKVVKPPNLSPGCSVCVRGILKENQKGQVEMQATHVEVIGEGNVSNGEYPFSMKQKHDHDYCRTFLHLRPKLEHFQALLRLRHRATLATHNFFDSFGFYNVHTPILTSNDCEGAGEVFAVSPSSQQLIASMRKEGEPDENAFFGNPGYLSVSGQLHLESVSRSFCKVYSFSPTFRAENSKSRLHLSEFYMIESEEAFVDDLASILNTMEAFVKYLVKNLLERSLRDIEIITNYDSVDSTQHLHKLGRLVNCEFVTMNFKEACNIIERHRDRFKNVDCVKRGFTKEQELFLVEHAGSTPVFVVDWPKSLKPFYMKTAASSDIVSAVDLLVPNVGELCGGSLREDNYTELHIKLKALNLVKDLQWYLDLRRYGNVPTGGFGMGFERFLQLVSGLANIKDTIPFPRWPHSLKM